MKKQNTHKHTYAHKCCIYTRQRRNEENCSNFRNN